jgi:tetratricopeptide (TPR) repeat protein
VVAEAVVPELDACAALRADLAARDGSAPDGLPAGPAAAADSPVSRDVRSAAWLPLVVGLERAARLARRGLPAHFRRQQAAWDAAAAAFGEARYARVGRRLARWRSADPGLRLVEELLWALEQPEAAGYTRLALAGVTALGALVPADDVRAGYVLAQSARAVRTLGDAQNAVERYRISEVIGRRFQDAWLRARAAVGLGTTHEYLGNYPAARAAFDRVLDERSPDPHLAAAAHHGLLISAMTAQDWDTALREGWHLLRAGKSGSIAKSEVLNLMAELCHRIGRHAVAVRAAEAAFRLSARPDVTVASLAILVDLAVTLGDRQLGLRYGSMLRSHLGGSAGPFEDARALLALASMEQLWGARDTMMRDLERARRIADAHRYHELQFKVEQMSDASAALYETTRGISEQVHLSGHSEDIVSQINALDEHDLCNAAAVSR